MLVVVKAGDVNNVQALLDTNPWLVQAQVAYLRPAGNVSRPLPYRLRYMNQPVLSPPNRFSPSRSILMACMRLPASITAPATLHPFSLPPSSSRRAEGSRGDFH